MPGEGLSNIHIEGEKLLALQDVLGMEKARELANDQKGKAFGMLSSLLSRPKAEDIDIVYEEKRYDAFWHIIGNARFEYKRRKTYTVPLDPVVRDVDLLEKNFSADQATRAIRLKGVEHCVEEYREEERINAQTGQAGDFLRYLSRPTRQIQSTDELTKDGALVAALDAKPAFLIRKVVNALIKPIQADQILDEQIGISDLCLYFVPLYTFELHWKAKEKRVTISFDGTTGELRTQANKITEKLRTSFTNQEIFEFGKEVANFVPGGGLAMMVGKKAIELYEK